MAAAKKSVFVHPDELSIGKIPTPSKIFDDSDNLKTWSDITLRCGELYEVTSWIANFTYLPTVKFQYSRSKSKTRAKHTAASLDRRIVLDHLSKNLGA